MSFQKNFIIRTTIIIYIYIFSILLKADCNSFVDIKKLSLYNNNYFVVLDSGLYFYNFNSLDGVLLYNFDSSIYRGSNDKVNITEFKDENNLFIFCFVNEYLFIFNEYNNKTFDYKVNEIDTSKNIYYTLLIYKVEDDYLNFFIASSENPSKITLYSYNYFPLSQNINGPEKIIFDNIKITDHLLRCLINSPLNYIVCFYYEKVNKLNYLKSVQIEIKEMKSVNKISFKTEAAIKQIKFVMSINNDIFICILLQLTELIPYCYINTYLSDILNPINCEYTTQYDPNYRVLYFNETGDYMFASRSHLTTTLVSSFNNSVLICRKAIFSKQKEIYSIIYDKEINNYKVVNYQNDFKNYKEFEKTIIESELPNLNSRLYTSNSSSIKIKSEKSKEEILKSNILVDKILGVTYEIIGEDYTLIIKPTNSNDLPDRTHVEFDECEQILRGKCNISNSSIITFIQIEVGNNDENSLYNQIKYFAYDEEKKKLDLSLCGDVESKIHYSIKNNSKLDVSSISEFKELGIDVLNIKDKFFNDLCYPYSDSQNDMILEDRMKYIYQNFSLCEEGCSYNNINIDKMNIICNCKIQEDDSLKNLSFNPLIFDQPKESSFFDSNIGIIKCYNLVFSMNNKSSNIGFITFILLIIIYLIAIIANCARGIKSVSDYLKKEMFVNGYITGNNINLLEGKNNTKQGIKNKIKTNIQKIKKKNKTNKKKTISNPNKIQNSKFSKLKSNQKKEGINNIKSLSLNTGNIIDKKNNSKRSILGLRKNIKPKVQNQNIFSKLNRKINTNNNFGIIKINLKENINNYFPQTSNQSLDNYTFEEAVKYDKRNIFRIAYIYLLSKQIIFRTFCQKSPLELFPVRLTVFIFMFTCDLALNALFYFNDNISKKFHYAKNIFLFTLNNNITIIIYSTLVSTFLLTFISKLSNSSKEIRNVFRIQEQKLKKNRKYKISDKDKIQIYFNIQNILKRFKIKIAILFLIETILILFFGYFVTAFCHVYSSTQISWLIDSFLSILSRLIFELLSAFFFGKLYQISVRSGIKCLYNAVMCIYGFS